MSVVKTYDPKKCLVIIGGVPMSGFGEDTFVAVARDEDAFTKVVGADGEVSRSKSANRAGSLTLTLMQTSLSNDVLSALAAADELDGRGVVPVLIKDLTGTTTLFAAHGWIRKVPDVELGKDIGTREWVIDTADMDVFVGGTLL